MKDIGLIHIYVNGIVTLQGIPGNIILNGGDVVVDKQLSSIHIPSKTTDPVIHSNNVRVKAADKVIQRLQRRNFPAGGYVNIHSEGRDVIFRVCFRKGVHCNVTFIQMSVHRAVLRLISAAVAGIVHQIRIQSFFRNENIHRSSLRLIILFGNIQDLGADHLGHLT